MTKVGQRLIAALPPQFPIYAKLPDGKATVAEIIRQETGVNPTRFAMNMWRARGAIPPKYVLLIMEYAAEHGIKVARSDFLSCDTLKTASNKRSSTT